MVNIERPDFDEPREQGAHQIVNRTDERVWFRREDEAEYYDGESAPG